MHVLFLLFCALVTSSAAARERTTIAVVGIHQESLTRDAQTAAAEEIAEAIEKLGKFDALLPNDLTWIIQGREEVILQDAFSRRGRRLLDDGKTLYAQAQADEALPVIEAAADELAQSMSATNAQNDLWEALFLLGTTQKALGQEPTTAWLKAISLNPDREPNSSEYPPPVIQAYQTLQASQLKKRGKLIVTGDQPGLKIWINGESRGETPLTLTDVAVGDVHVVARDQSGQQAYQLVTVSETTAAKVTLTVEGGQWGLPSKTTRDQVRGSSDLYRAIGEHAEVDLLLVVGESLGKVTLQLYSPRMDAFSNPLKKSLTGAANDEIVAALGELLQLATPDGALLSMATTPDAAPLDPRSNRLLGKMLLSPDPVAAPGSKIKWWHIAIASGGALTVGGVVTGVIVGNNGSDPLDPNQGTIVIGPIP